MFISFTYSDTFLKVFTIYNNLWYFFLPWMNFSSRDLIKREKNIYLIAIIILKKYKFIKFKYLQPRLQVIYQELVIFDIDI